MSMMRIIFMMMGILLIPIIAEAHEINIMPKELVDLARANDCEQVSDFYEPHNSWIYPPFVYGYLPGDPQNSVVFWCRKRAKVRNQYLLVFVFKITHELTSCPNKIEWQNYPGGLAIYKDSNDTLDEFYYLDNPDLKAPRGLRMKNPAVFSSNGSTDETFYCYEGKWLIRMRD